MSKKLYRSKDDRVVAGVCGGIAEYFGIDAIIIRLIWLFMILFGGVGMMAYIICAIFIPKKKSGIDLYKYKGTENEINNVVSKNYLGFFLVLLGGYFLLTRVFHFTWLRIGNYWPLFLIVAGFYLIFKDKEEL